MSDHRPSAIKRVGGRRRPLSGLGLILIVIGAAVLVLNFVRLPYPVPRLWPVLIMVVGVFGLLRRPGWIEELDVALPGAAASTDRHRRRFSLLLIGIGAVLLVFSLHLVDERIIGPLVLVVLGGLLIWRRSR